MLDFFIQETAQGAAEIEPEVTEKTLSIMELIVNGGTGGMIIIGTLAFLLFIALYVYFERLFAIKAASKYDINFIKQIRDTIASGNLQAAKLLCVKQSTPVSRLTEKGISRIGSPLDDINTAIENAGRLEVYKLEKNVSVLATIAGVAPMIGFLGTVIGMVLAFHQLATSSGQAEMGLLAEGIYTAMTTTVAGLIVGIIAYIAYNHLVVQTDKVVHQMEATAVDFLDLLNEPA
jgi:biopolymer transport protein ExbB